ncbi:prepilin-type N-terminal cleavage/methylation domain-containing protein [Motilibacter peucedani]|uniref:Prepilin-type N-terminal cleavage/methylation domain-containing protein n=1 Tax=Motilibacter peucedani TaxID=598650 RepID=A0A420XSA8_9ACTN|nr:prepilin-type N-terminal cleavage/methylation domain-containing protein [Motilibacter peucedani]RKS77754.1 prepilin-type N-terminal cleavage/methylation domain-containing protein [Motilibacter peucedani]
MKLAATRSDDGFSLVEVLWAMVIFGVVSTAVISTVLVTQTRTLDNTRRSQASSVASTTVDTLRAQAAGNGFRDTLRTTGRTTKDVTVNGSVYHVVTDTVWQTRSQAASGCGAAVDRSYVQAHVQVTWDRMGSTQPVRADTILTPLAGTYDDTLGSICLKVTDHNGAPVAGATAVLDGSATQVTTAQGVTLFPYLTAGNHSVSVSGSDLVTRQGATATAATAAVTAGATTSIPLDMDHAAAVQLVGTNLLPASVNVALTASNSGMSPTWRAMGTLTRTPGDSTLLTGLYPFANGYALSVGACTTPSVPAAQTPAGAIGSVALPKVTLTTTASVVTATYCPGPGPGPGPGQTVVSIPVTPNVPTTVALWPGSWTLAGATSKPVTLAAGDTTSVQL